MTKREGEAQMNEQNKLRRCKVDGVPAMFHRWCDVAEIVPPSVLKGGHSGGVVKDTFGIVEYADGSVVRVKPERIIFDTDTEDDPGAKDISSEETKAQSGSGKKYKETKIKCPYCKGENKNAIVFCDTAAREYFVYCPKCGIETIDSFPTSARAIKAFSDGKNKNISEREKE